MRPCVEHDEEEFRVVLLPDEQPVGLDVALPLPLSVAVKLVRPVFCRQTAVTLKQFHRLPQFVHRVALSDAASHVLVEGFGRLECVCHQSPNFLK